MKKTLALITVLVIIITGCNDDSVIPQQIHDHVAVSNVARVRTLDEAMQIAVDAISMLPTEQSRGSVRSINSTHTKIILNKRVTRNNYTSDTLMYVFNFDNDAGFAIVSANRATDGLFAITESGHYYPEEPQDNPGFDLFIDAARNYIILKPDSMGNIGDIKPIDPDPRVQYKVVRDTVKNIILPKLPLKWGQSGIEGRFCSNGLSGCSNTAAAMALCYLRFPTQLTITFDNSNSVVQLDWDKIAQHVIRDKCSSCTSDSHNTIGLLCRELGHRSNSKYYPEYDNDPRYGTSTQTSDTRSTLLNLGLSVSPITDYDPQQVVSLLNSNNILLMRGDCKDIDNSGHMWIVDGYRRLTIYTRDYILRSNSIKWELLKEEVDYVSLNHINWGWNGTANGYFKSDVFNAYTPEIPDGETLGKEPSVNRYNYNHSLKLFSVSKP